MYQALYRKWRPQTFADVVAQPHIITTLTNQIKTDKTAHAYLFTGSRGTGKTTCARILAKALNCLNPVDGNPCLKCQNCIDADNFSLTDLVEIDAASNGSVNDARELRNSTAYTPVSCKYKIFIIDEVHMLTAEAFNALLKILEEPPEYVKFILATTEVHKILVTILSRCQRFDFRRILPESIADRLEYVSKEENIKITHDAALLIATLSDGGMRDALSLLDRCTAFGEEITADVVTNVAGVSGRIEIFRLIEAIIAGDTTAATGIITNLYNNSKDMIKLSEELILQFRNVMLLQINPNQVELLSNAMPNEIEHIQKMANTITLQQTLHLLSILQKCSENMLRVPNKRIELEMCIVNMCLPQNVSGSQNVPQTPTFSQPQPPNIPQTLTFSQSTPPNIPQAPTFSQPLPPNIPPTPTFPQPQPSNIPQKTPIVETQSQNIPTNSQINDNLEIITNWNDILLKYRNSDPAGAGLLQNSNAYLGYFKKELIIYIFVNSTTTKEYFTDKDKQSVLKTVIKEILGKEYKVWVKSSEELLVNQKTPVQVENLPKQEENAPVIPPKNAEITAYDLIRRAKENNIIIETE